MSEEQKVEETPTTTIELKKGLPSVGDLFNDAWGLFKAKWLKLLVFFLIVLGISMLFFGVLMIAAFMVGFGTVLSEGSPEAIAGIFTTSAVFIPGGLFVIVFILAFIAFNIASQAGMILLIADEKSDQSAFSYLKKGFPFVIPLIVIGIINFVLIAGASVLLLIPGIIVMIFLWFSMYVAVLENKKAMDAIGTSVSMISQNFWGIVGRMLLFFLLSILVQLIIGQLAESEVMGPLGFILIMALSVGVNWFGIAYIYSLYKHARGAYDESKKSSITWMWVVAIIGWIIIVLSFGGIMKLAGNQEIQDAFMEGFTGEFEQEMEAEFGEDFNFDEELNVNSDLDFDL